MSRHDAFMRQQRTDLGAHFSEGARLLWERKESRGLSIEDIRRRLNASSGLVNLWLYGDKKPGLKFLTKLAEDFEVPVCAWTEEPTKPFVLPINRKVAA